MSTLVKVITNLFNWDDLRRQVLESQETNFTAVVKIAGRGAFFVTYDFESLGPSTRFQLYLTHFYIYSQCD